MAINEEKLKELLLYLIGEIENLGHIKADFDAKEKFSAAFPREEWKPEHRKRFFRLNSQGKIIGEDWTGTEKQKSCLAFGNCFPTQADAEAHKAKWLEFISKK